MHDTTKRGIYKRRLNKTHLTKILFTHDLQKNGDIEVSQFCSSDYLTYLFTKVLPYATYEKFIRNHIVYKIDI